MKKPVDSGINGFHCFPTHGAARHNCIPMQRVGTKKSHLLGGLLRLRLADLAGQLEIKVIIPSKP